MQNWEEVKAELNLIKLQGCEDIRIGDVLHYSLQFYYDDVYDLKSLRKSILRIMGHSVLSTYRIKKTGEGNNIFLLSNSISNRADHTENMRRVMSTVDNRIEIVSSDYKMNLCAVFLFYYIFKWNKSLKKVFPNQKRRIFYISHLYRVFLDYERIKKKLDKMDVKSFITYCDVLEADNYFTQKMNNNGVITITLQHGIYGSERNAWATYGSCCNYFFAQGPYMIDLANYLKCNIKDKMKFVGLVSYADAKSIPTISSKKTEALGVFLIGGLDKTTHEINVSMINMANEIGKRRGLRILIKFHPILNMDEYSEVIQNKEQCFGGDITIEAFIDMIDVGIVHFSTTLIELLYNYKFPFIYKKDNEIFHFCDGNKIIGFDNIGELELLFERCEADILQRTEMIERMRQYFIGQGIPYEVYKRTFKSIGVN